ncbi:MAG: CASTOR/POLLUX-related putative ion channel [Verrucomicrobiales bacterium]
MVAEIFDDQRLSIIQENCPFQISVVDSADILAKIMVQTSRSVGLSTVYSELLSFDGCQMYFYGNDGRARLSERSYFTFQMVFRW